MATIRKVTVLKKHIRGAKRCNSRQCPVARALGPAATVNASVVHVSEGLFHTAYTPSKTLANQITRFDRTGVFTPGTYTLRKRASIADTVMELRLRQMLATPASI
jgi:hypothetical protein